MIQFGRRYIGLLEAPLDRLSRESGPVFDAIEAFFFNGGDQLSVNDQSRGRIAMKGVDTENIHREGIRLSVVSVESRE